MDRKKAQRSLTLVDELNHLRVGLRQPNIGQTLSVQTAFIWLHKHCGAKYCTNIGRPDDFCLAAQTLRCQTSYKHAPSRRRLFGCTNIVRLKDLCWGFHNNYCYVVKIIPVLLKNISHLAVIQKYHSRILLHGMLTISLSIFPKICTFVTIFQSGNWNFALKATQMKVMH